MAALDEEEAERLEIETLVAAMTMAMAVETEVEEAAVGDQRRFLLS